LSQGAAPFSWSSGHDNRKIPDVMNWVTIIWSVGSGACLTLALMCRTGLM